MIVFVNTLPFQMKLWYSAVKFATIKQAIGFCGESVYWRLVYDNMKSVSEQHKIAIARQNPNLGTCSYQQRAGVTYCNINAYFTLS